MSMAFSPLGWPLRPLKKKKSLSVVNFFEKSCILDACFLSENAPPSLLGAGKTVREKCPFGVFLLRIFPHSE